MTAEERKIRIRWGRLVVFAVLVITLTGAGATAVSLGAQQMMGHARSSGRIASVPEISYHSSTDADADGIDDQLDFLMGVRAYLDTAPVYQSVYYEGGWPTDGYGVCTDVVAQGMLAAGYDLQQLIAEDIAVAPEAYPVETPDSNIDFRRVRNQAVWLNRHCITLSTQLDPEDLSDWQPGDIVVFGENEHIGVVSDRVNEDGIPLLLHNGSPLQRSYEEDKLLLHSDEITGHYRIS